MLPRDKTVPQSNGPVCTFSPSCLAQLKTRMQNSTVMFKALSLLHSVDKVWVFSKPGELLTYTEEANHE